MTLTTDIVSEVCFVRGELEIFFLNGQNQFLTFMDILIKIQTMGIFKFNSFDSLLVKLITMKSD